MSDKKFITPGGDSFELRRSGAGSLEVRKEGEKKGLDVKTDCQTAPIDSSSWRIQSAGNNVRDLVWVYSRGNKRVISWPGGSLELDAADLNEGAGAGSSGLKPLKLTMPGKVLSVKVKAGDVVEPGQGLVIVEAMKMENLLQASARAKVQKVHVKEGDRLESGAVLLSFEPA